MDVSLSRRLRPGLDSRTRPAHRLLRMAIGIGAATATLAGLVLAPAPSAIAQDDERPPALYDETVLHELHLRFDRSDWGGYVNATRDVAADLELDGIAYPQIGVRYKGRSTLNIDSPKKPFNLSLDVFVAGQEIDGYDIINLDNGYLDPSQVREALSYHVMRDFLPASKAAFARVFVNGEYLGLYTMVQQVDRSFLREWGPSDEGDLFKAEPYRDDAFFEYRPTLEWEGEGLEAYRRRYELKGPPRSEAEEQAAYGRVRDLTRVLDAPVSAGGVSDDQFPEAIRSVLDVDGALWYLAAQNLLCNFDSYYFGHNYLLYRSEVDGRYSVYPWDLNLSLWGYPFAFFGPSTPDALVRANPLQAAGDRGLPLISRLLAVPRFRADYLAHFRSLRDVGLEPERVSTVVTGYEALIREAAREEPFSLHGFDAFEKNLRENYRMRTGAGFFGSRNVPGILSLTADRYAWLRDQATEPGLVEPDLRLATHERSPETPTPEQGATVSATFDGAEQPAGVTLVFRVDGGVPTDLVMRRDGAQWSATIPPQLPRARIRYFLRAELPDGRAQFHPAANITQAWRYRVEGLTLPRQGAGDLVINELQADNESTLADEAGSFDDWIELYNRGTAPVDLGGYYLSDDEQNPWAHTLPEITLEPGAHLLVWADNAPVEGPDHAPFRLNRRGDTIFLATREAIVDEIAFEEQPADRSFGRTRDGADEWRGCYEPTPGGSNRCTGFDSAPVYLPFGVVGR